MRAYRTGEDAGPEVLQGRSRAATRASAGRGAGKGVRNERGAEEEEALGMGEMALAHRVRVAGLRLGAFPSTGGGTGTPSGMDSGLREEEETRRSDRPTGGAVGRAVGKEKALGGTPGRSAGAESASRVSRRTGSHVTP